MPGQLNLYCACSVFVVQLGSRDAGTVILIAYAVCLGCKWVDVMPEQLSLSRMQCVWVANGLT